MNISPQHPPLPLHRPWWSRRQIPLAIGVLLLGGSAALAIASKAPKVPAHPALPPTALSVDVIAPSEVTIPRSVAASGSIGARDELIIGSDASGVRLVEVRVDIGATVRRGQLLALGDDTQLAAQLAQQEAAVRAARAELAQAAANLERAERIQDSGVYSVEAIQTRRTAAEAAAAKLDLALAQKRELEVRIGHTRVRAAADGVISKRSATVGAVMQPGTELFRLMRDGEIEWRAELPGHAIAQVAPGAVVRLSLDDGRSVEGRVRLVAPTIDAVSRNGVVHVALPAGTPLKAGSHARGEILVGSVTTLAVPESVVLRRDGQDYVYTLGSGDVARLTRIETGVRRQGLVEIRGGIGTAARVVATGAGFVKDGERVRVAEKAQPGGQSS